jgi:short-subunit dehydrogenase
VELAYVRLSFRHSLALIVRVVQFEYVRQLSANENNTVFGIVRNKTTATQLATLNRSNVHIIQADITDHEALKVSQVNGLHNYC